MIEVGLFCHVKCSRYLDYGIKKNDLVYVAGETMMAVDEKDPYAYRKLFVVAYTKEGHVDAVTKPITMDGVNLRPVSKSKNKELYAQMEKDFSEE